MRKPYETMMEEGRGKRDVRKLSAASSNLPLIPLLSSLFVTMLCLFSLIAPAYAEDKSWNAQGDQTDWFDDANWLPVGAPSATDTAKIDLLDTAVDLSQNYEMQSLTLGGKKASHLSVGNFTTGNVTPAEE